MAAIYPDRFCSSYKTLQKRSDYSQLFEMVRLFQNRSLYSLFAVPNLFELFGVMLNHLCLNQINYVFGNIGGVVADTL